ncbi:hypothetical protein G6F68_016130 [Rhizopus microsporus]|nr:hypothetical protein G6F68_016130 [Rhizopus microsporus]
MVTIGVMLGRALGSVAGKRAEVLGGIALIGIGSLILYEHLTAAAAASAMAPFSASRRALGAASDAASSSVWSFDSSKPRSTLSVTGNAWPKPAPSAWWPP